MPPETAADVFDAELAAELPASVDRAAIRRVQFVAQLLDESIRVPGIDYRIGIDPILGVVPGAGDSVSALLSTYIVLESARLGVTYGTLVRMLANITADFVSGSIPFVGTIIDAAWKANKRNVELLVSELTENGDDRRRRPIPVQME